MIEISDKHNCCGCEACVQACPRHCISFEEDNEGFLYPQVDKINCIDCGLCEKVCPILTKNNIRKPIGVYAAINPNLEERLNSSSGGIFSLLARTVILKGGIVFGAAFDEEWNVHHIAIEREEELHFLQGSKYVQSRIEKTYQEVKQNLNEGRLVLFSGTSCQVAGLRLYLRKGYKNLLTVDVVCHGVPSPKVWNSYLKSIGRLKSNVNEESLNMLTLNEKPYIESISFRDKHNGWKKFGLAVQYSSDQGEFNDKALSPIKEKYILRESLHKNLYLQGFLKNIYLRPSCHRCKVRNGKSGSDIALGDFWGIQNILPEIDDDKGVSLVITYSEKGDNIIKTLGAILYNTEYKDALACNPCLESSVGETKYRGFFWSTYSDDEIIKSITSILNQSKPSPVKTLTSQMIKYIHVLSLKLKKLLKIR